jgi:hypothetical protein
MRIIGTAAALSLLALPALAQDVTFTCSIITASNPSQGATLPGGYDINVTNPGPSSRQCTASCTVTNPDGGTRTGSTTKTVVAGANNAFFFGEDPPGINKSFSNAQLGSTSCQ